MDQRTARSAILMGANGTGKTTLLHNIIKELEQKTIIITPDDAEWREYTETELMSKADFNYTGIKRHIFDPSKRGTLARLEYFKQGVIIFDDCRAYLGAATADPIRQLLIRRRQREVDVFAVGHGFTEIPPVFFTFATDLFLFRTTDNIVRRKNVLKEYERTFGTQQRVNAKAKQNPHYYEWIKYT